MENLDRHSPVRVKGRLCKNQKFCQDIGASRWILEVICHSCLPFIEQPERKFVNNFAGARKNVDFVTNEIEKLILSGALVEVEVSDLTVCSPLGVVTNTSGKSRLILDLTYVNKHLRVTKFKYEDRTAGDLFQKGGRFLKFDYMSGYHHVEILSDHTKFVGCAWVMHGQKNIFNSLFSTLD